MNALSSLRYRLLTSKFRRAGFTYVKEDSLQGWQSRDPYTGELILWSTETNSMYRKRGEENWRESPETKKKCIEIGCAHLKMKKHLEALLAEPPA